MTFRDSLISYYASHNNGRNAISFMAFALMLKCINYNGSVDFCYKICGYSPQGYRRLHFLILTGRVSDKIPRQFRFSKVNMFYFFAMLLDLKIRISNDLLNKIRSFATDSQSVEIEYLCKQYFKWVKQGVIDDILDMNEADRLFWLMLYFECYYVKIDKAKNKMHISSQESPFYSKIGKFYPSFANSNNVWGNILPFHIKSIPMGGQNK